jgi:hypothetical protein
LLSDFTHIIDDRCVDEHTRPNAENLYAFLDRVGSSACRIAHNGDLLSRQPIDEATLAAVAPPEDADMGFQVLCHVYFQFL